MPAPALKRSDKSNRNNELAIDFGALPELVGYQLRLAQIRVFRDFMETLGEHEISPGLLGVLMLIESNPGLTQSALAAAVHLDRSTMVGVIDRLEQRGWAERRAAPEDRRAYQLMITRQGTTQLRDFKSSVAAHEKRILNGLSNEEIATLHRLLPKIASR